MRGPTLLREVRQLAELPLRRETINHLVFNPHAIESPTLNRLIAADPALALGLLRIMPRALSDSKLSVPQIARAANAEALLAVLGTGVAEPSDRMRQPTATMDRLWAHSVATAHAARELSRARDYPHAQTAFLAGLLHNVGLLALAAVAPGTVETLLNDARHACDSLELEQDRLGTTHPNVGRQLAKRWGLPHWLIDVIWWHHQADGLPRNIRDRVLVQLVREADAVVSQSEFSLDKAPDTEAWGLPWENGDAIAAAVSRGVRQAWAFLQDHPLRSDNANGLTARTIELACENVTLRADTGWRRLAWEKWSKLPADAAPAELAELVAETYAHATGALGVCCYVRSEDGTAAQGSFWSDAARPLNCALAVGAGTAHHTAQVVTQLRAAWHKRPYRTIDLQRAEEPLAHVLVWLDEFALPPGEATLEAASALCTDWLAHAAYVEQLEMQLNALVVALREQSAEAAARLEDDKLAALAEMAAGAGHEINNPLAVISGRAQLLITEESDPRRRKALETIGAQAQRIHRMIVDLMMFARPPAPELRPLAVSDVIQRAVGNVQAEADERKIALTVATDATLPRVSGDLNQLSTALECVLQNSLEALNSAGGAVAVTARAACDSAVELRITDNGPGIPETHRPHIFEPFYSGRDAGRGLGMGLPKAWRFVQLHGGTIQIDSGDRGTTVIIRLPALADDSQQRACA